MSKIRGVSKEPPKLPHALIGYCSKCDLPIYRDEKWVSIRGFLICNRELITQQILAEEALLVNDPKYQSILIPKPDKKKPHE